MMAGAHSSIREPTDKERAWLTSPKIVKLLQEQQQQQQQHTGDALTTLNPVGLTSQVVAGTVYQVKYHTVGWKHVHAKIFRPLPCDNKPPEVLGFVAECRAEDPFVF
jgi:hypothetical protein